MAETVHCENCGSTWAAENLAPIHDYWSRVDPGGVVPVGQCPNTECGALCYPSFGYVSALEQRLSAMQDVLARLLSWAESMGGWEAPVWDDTRRLLTQLAQDDAYVSEPAGGES